MKQENNRFGEVMCDSLYSYKDQYTYNLPTEWGPKYEASRDAADAAIKKYGLSEEDFWIKKTLSDYKDKIIYSNLILSHAGCIKVNEQQPEEKQFKPGCVREAKGTADGGVALLYSSDEQRLFKTGEASPRNSNVSYLYAVAEKRLFDRVVTALSGLYEDGVYGEDEADSFRKNRNVISGDEVAPSAAPTAPRAAWTETSTPARADVAPCTPAPTAPAVPMEKAPASLTDAERAAIVKKIKDGVRFTQTNINAMLDYYNSCSLESMNDEALLDCDCKIAAKVSKRAAALNEAKAAIAATTPAPTPVEPQNATGLSPIAAMLVNEQADQPAPEIQEVPTVPVEAPLGETVYAVTDDAPQTYKDLAGQTFDQIGKDILTGLYKRKNALGRKYVDPDLLIKIEEFIA